MSVQRILAGTLVLAGGIILATGMEAMGHGADECIPSEAISPAICVPAAQVPPRKDILYDDTREGCVNWFYFWCWPDPDIGCWTEGYGWGRYGRCFHSLDEAATGFCFEDYNPIVLQLQYHRSECEFFNGECECIWLIGGQPTQPYKVCDCAKTP